MNGSEEKLWDKVNELAITMARVEQKLDDQIASYTRMCGRLWGVGVTAVSALVAALWSILHP